MTHFNWRGISKRIFILNLYIENSLSKIIILSELIEIKNVITELRALVRPSCFIVVVKYSSTSPSSSHFSLHPNLLSSSKVNLSFSRKSSLKFKCLMKFPVSLCAVHLNLFSQFKSDRFWYFVNNIFQAVFIYHPLKN